MADSQAPVASPSAPPTNPYTWGTGRRKTAVARVRIRPGDGKFIVNKRPLQEYFVHEEDRNTAQAPLAVAENASAWDVFVNIKGGGSTGQAGAVKLGLARALRKAVPELEGKLRDSGMLTRDAREVERKKPGRPGARKSFQFSKR